jgi:SecD/SecF fusion protein
MSNRQRHGLILLLVAGLIAVSFVLIATKPTRLGLDLKGGVELVYKAEPTPQSPVNATSLQRAVDVMQNRVNQLGVTQPQIQTSGSNQIDVQLPDVTNIKQAEQAVGTTARLEFYDWEANAITPNGQTVASQLAASDTTALAISQGSSAAAPGSTSAATGAMTLYEAVKVASKQPYKASKDNARLGSQWFLFGAPGSAACKALATALGTKVQAGVHCSLASPVQVSEGTTKAQALPQLYQSLRGGLVLTAAEKADTQALEVKQGTVVLQATSASYPPPTFGTTNQGYYVLKDHVALFGNEITNPEESTDSTGSPDVQFGFTGQGNSAFQNITAKIAERGQLVSLGSEQLNQHFAVALDQQLVSVPDIQFSQFPDGISGGGADIQGNFTVNSADQLATQLRLGALPIKLNRISETQVSATLGSQALHQGLIAGLIGLGVVVLFLLFYYRLLGLIAVSGLVAYGIYFYALIKLIPITMSLAGIAGLVLTIGVAADANVVIFERVKEEIRAGRSVRQGIAIGYRKGLTAIIDANVVTIMTAFILFVLATSDVKGFAFTLGIGTIVSLFTAVLATQAILMTVGDSRAIQSPSALGAGGNKRVWRFDFMGASRYFFSMSGLILLIGALAVGGRGLNLGIDFTSGTQISVGLNKAATVQQVRSVMTSVGAGNATIQAVSGDKTLGPHGYQISSTYLGSAKYSQLRNELGNRFGIRTSAGGNQDLNTTSVGPTFGSTVTKSAVIAIIISLIVISIYVTLRFDWKFAVPVLIALAHDLLITSGIYALTGRVVTTDTVAALLTILGYSLYDTIIVFDRVRENIPRMPRAAFSQIVNRSMSEVLTRSLVTTSCTLLPVIALLLFGGSTLKDFAFALLIGIASGAYSSIFIASPVLMHWKERERGYTARRKRIEAEFGTVPAYADGGDVDPTVKTARRTGRLTTPDAENVSAAEFEQMKRDIASDIGEPSRQTSSLATRTSHVTESDEASAPPRGGNRQQRRSTRTRPAGQRASGRPAQGPNGGQQPAPPPPPPTPSPEPSLPEAGSEEAANVAPAPDLAENEGVAPTGPKSSGGSSSRRNRRHGRRT